MADLPYNTIGTYSYSKYFGVTGWRLGTIALHEENVFDKLIKKLPYSIRKRTNRRYDCRAGNDPHEKRRTYDKIYCNS